MSSRESGEYAHARFNPSLTLSNMVHSKSIATQQGHVVQSQKTTSHYSPIKIIFVPENSDVFSSPKWLMNVLAVVLWLLVVVVDVVFGAIPL